MCSMRSSAQDVFKMSRIHSHMDMDVPMSASMVELICICLLGVGGAAICSRVLVLGDTCDVVK